MGKTDAFNLGASMFYDYGKQAWKFEGDIRETKVQKLVRTCGIRMTALYLKNRGYTAEQAVTLMFR